MSMDYIEKRIELKAPVARVWRALTNHVEFGRWFRANLDGPFAVGKTSRGMMTYPGFEHMPWEAVVEKMETERLFSFRWPHVKDAKEDSAKAPWTLVEFRLTPTSDGTLLVVRESGFDKFPADKRADAMRGNEGGWAEQMQNIARHVAQT